MTGQCVVVFIICGQVQAFPHRGGGTGLTNSNEEALTQKNFEALACVTFAPVSLSYESHRLVLIPGEWRKLSASSVISCFLYPMSVSISFSTLFFC